MPTEQEENNMMAVFHYARKSGKLNKVTTENIEWYYRESITKKDIGWAIQQLKKKNKIQWRQHSGWTTIGEWE